MENSLYPAFVRIDYTSQWGPHSMTIPSVPVEPTTIGGSVYQFILRGAALPANVEGAVTDFVNLLKPKFEATTRFNAYTLFTMSAPDATPTPVESNILGIPGVAGGASWDKAVQATLTWRTDEFGIFKMVLLDCISNNSFDKLTDLSADPSVEDLSDYVTAGVTWVAGRDGGRPNTFLQMAVTLNEKLRRSYRMN